MDIHEPFVVEFVKLSSGKLEQLLQKHNLKVPDDFKKSITPRLHDLASTYFRLREEMVGGRGVVGPLSLAEMIMTHSARIIDVVQKAAPTKADMPDAAEINKILSELIEVANSQHPFTPAKEGNWAERS